MENILDYGTPDIVQRELRDDERPVWIGRPRAGRFAVSKGWHSFLFGIPFLGFSLFWEYHAAAGGLFFQLWGIPFIAVGLGMLGSPIWKYWQALRTHYVVTDRRLLILNGALRPTVESYGPPFDLERRDRGDGSGTVVFARKLRDSRNSGRSSEDIGFFAISDVREVERMIAEVGKAGADGMAGSANFNVPEFGKPS